MMYNFCPHCMRSMTVVTDICPSCGKNINVYANVNELPIGSELPTSRGYSYIIGKVKGGGGFGMTYIAKRKDTGGIVAIKEYFPGRCSPIRQNDLSLLPDRSMTELYNKGMSSFMSEASMLRAINYIPSIVHVIDFFKANNTAYTVMEYLNGETLAQYMEKYRRFEPTDLFNKMLPLMQDMQKVHEARVIHRDIAPDNIFLMPDGSMKLIDFGCARSMEDGKSMTVVLKPGFAPIEQYQTRGQDSYTDVYSLSATIYYCLSGTVPPDAVRRITDTTVNGKPDPLLRLSQLGVNIDPGIENLLMWGLEIQPDKRVQTMKQLADGLVGMLPKENDKVLTKYTIDSKDDNVPAVVGTNYGGQKTQFGKQKTQFGKSNTQYGTPPGTQYGTPPGTQYGTPPGTQYGTPPGTQYGTPPGTQYNNPPPGTQYGNQPPAQQNEPLPIGLIVIICVVALIAIGLIIGLSLLT